MQSNKLGRLQWSGHSPDWQWHDNNNLLIMAHFYRDIIMSYSAAILGSVFFINWLAFTRVSVLFLHVDL